MFNQMHNSSVLLAVEAPMLNPPSTTATFTVAGITFLASLFIYKLLGIFRESNLISAIRFVVLALGIGTLMVTFAWFLEFGDLLRSLLADILAVIPGISGAISTSGSELILTVLIIIGFIAALKKFQGADTDKEARLWFWLLVIASALFFSASWGRELVMFYTENVAPTLGRLVLVLTEYAHITTG